MIKYKSRCVSCDLSCIYEQCPYYREKVRYCDKCNEEADYIIDGDDYCEDCAEEYLAGILKELSLKEKAAIIGVDLKSLREH